MQHHVADGMSGIHCINTWSEMARGIPLKVPPFIDRTLLKANSPPAPKYPHIEYQPPPRLIQGDVANDIGNGHGNGHENSHGPASGACYMIGNGHSGIESHVANGKSNGSHDENGKSNGSHDEIGKSNGNHDENGKSNGSHDENGKSKGGHIGNGKTNGSHVENGKSNGSRTGNGKSSSVDKVMQHSSGHGNGYGGRNGAHYNNGNGNGNGVSNEAQYKNGNGNGNLKDVLSNGKLTNEFHRSNGESKGNTNGHSNGHGIGKVKEEDIPMAVRVFKFTKEQLAILKQMAVEGKTDVIFSSYEMLSGHIWKCATQARKLEDSQETKLFVATDGRSRLNPTLPKGYFGNVIFTCTPIATAGELVANPVTYAARKVPIPYSYTNIDHL